MYAIRVLPRPLPRALEYNVQTKAGGQAGHQLISVELRKIGFRERPRPNAPTWNLQALGTATQ